MPELPEVETTRRGISPHVKGAIVDSVTVRQRQLRWPIPHNFSTLLTKQKLVDIKRRGKYLLLDFQIGHALIHLGMSGSLRIVSPATPPKKHDHVDILFDNNACLRFHDPRRFGAMLWTKADPMEHKLIAHLGPEPLDESFNSDYLYSASRKRSKDIKSLIMDSKIVVGVGNIYANEALFISGIRPTKASGRVTRTQIEQLVDAIKQVLQRSITQGGTTLRDFVGGDGKPGYFVQQLNVYGREGLPCKQCSKPLKSVRQAQRATVYCTQCQS